MSKECRRAGWARSKGYTGHSCQPWAWGLEAGIGFLGLGKLFFEKLGLKDVDKVKHLFPDDGGKYQHSSRLNLLSSVFSIRLLSPVLSLIRFLITLQLVNGKNSVHGKNAHEYQQYLK